MDTLTIGQMARRAGVGIDTVRFYERRGLIEAPPRQASGYREYPPRSLRRLRFIRRAKVLGFSLKEVGELLALHPETATGCADAAAHAREKIAAIDAKIEALQTMRSGLEELAAACGQGTPLHGCPLLAALAGPDEGADGDEG